MHLEFTGRILRITGVLAWPYIVMEKFIIILAEKLSNILWELYLQSTTRYMFIVLLLLKVPINVWELHVVLTQITQTSMVRTFVFVKLDMKETG